MLNTPSETISPRFGSSCRSRAAISLWAKRFILQGSWLPISCREAVVEFVLPQQELLAEQRFKHRLIGRKTAVEEQHRLHSEPLGQGLLKLLVGTAVTGHSGEAPEPVP